MKAKSNETKGYFLPGFLRRYHSTILAALFIILPTLYLTKMWMGYQEPWLHTELLNTSNVVWSSPEGERFLDRLGKIFDWTVVDPNARRVQQLNDVAEVVDTIARPYFTQYFGPHPSMTPSDLLTAIFGPLLLFGYLRQCGVDRIRAAALVAIFLSSIGFLSVLIPYIRPAKKLAILMLCLCLYLAQRHTQNGRALLFWVFIMSLYLSFFTDEIALANFFIAAMLFFPSLLQATPKWKRLVFLSLPLLFVATVLYILPPSTLPWEI